MNFSLKKLFKKILALTGETYYVDSSSLIGKYTFIGEDTAITASHVGNYCSIAPRVLIGMGEHDLNLVSTSSLFYENAYQKLTEKSCVVESDVWIGANAIVLRGVKIGIGAVIGAGAVVTKDVPAFAVAVGVPAKIIKYRFDEKKRMKILQSEWWMHDLTEALEIIKRIE